MPTFKCPITFQVTSFVYINAENEAHAKQFPIKKEGDVPYPHTWEYLGGEEFMDGHSARP